jgi:hypothetical protein
MAEFARSIQRGRREALSGAVGWGAAQLAIAHPATRMSVQTCS